MLILIATELVLFHKKVYQQLFAKKIFFFLKFSVCTKKLKRCVFFCDNVETCMTSLPDESHGFP